jgi:hypothetical protein
MERANISGRTLRTAFVLLLVVGVTILFLAVAWPFLKPLLLGAMLAGPLASALSLDEADRGRARFAGGGADAAAFVRARRGTD